MPAGRTSEVGWLETLGLCVGVREVRFEGDEFGEGRWGMSVCMLSGFVICSGGCKGTD